MVTEIAARIGEALRVEFPERADLCICASKIGLDVYRYFGIEAKPLVVRAFAYNERFKQSAHMPLDDPRWQEAMDDGAWNVSIDEVDHNIPGRYPGHVVLVIEEQRVLVDLTTKQFSRPQHGMDFPDIGVFDLPPDFMGGTPAIYGAPPPGSGYIAYMRRKSFKDFRTAPDWTRKSELAGQLIREIRKEL